MFPIHLIKTMILQHKTTGIMNDPVAILIKHEIKQAVKNEVRKSNERDIQLLQGSLFEKFLLNNKHV